jgi:hypothetical protein
MLLICDDALRLGLVVGKGSDGLGMVVCAGGGGRSVEWILALLNKYMAHGEKKHGRAKKTFTKSLQDEKIQEESAQGKSAQVDMHGG